MAPPELCFRRWELCTPRGSTPVLVAGDGRVAGPQAVGVRGDSPRAREANPFRPQVGRGTRRYFAGQAGRLSRQQREELVGEHPENVAERAG